jgi:hypothetical protein
MAIFGLVESDFIAILGLCIAGVSSVFTAIAFLITHSRNRKSEQIKIAREIQDKINSAAGHLKEFTDKNPYPGKGSREEKEKWNGDVLVLLGETLGPVRYFTYLVKQKELDDASVLSYYKDPMLIILKNAEASYAGLEESEEKAQSDTYVHATKNRREVLQFMKVWERI